MATVELYHAYWFLSQKKTAASNLRLPWTKNRVMKIQSKPEQMIGVWANAAAVRHSPHEFTIDFLRCEFDAAGNAGNGILVQRVNVSPLLASQLLTALQQNWSAYASKAMPKEFTSPEVNPTEEQPETDEENPSS